MAGGFAYGGGLSANSNNKVACCAPLLQAGNYVQLNSCAFCFDLLFQAMRMHGSLPIRAFQAEAPRIL